MNVVVHPVERDWWDILALQEQSRQVRPSAARSAVRQVKFCVCEQAPVKVLSHRSRSILIKR